MALSREPANDISAIVASLGYDPDFNWAWENYKRTIIEIARQKGLRRHLEIGGGRDPLFLPDEIVTLGFDVTLNDISARELSLAPAGYSTVVCDIAGKDAKAILGPERYDIAYSRMVMEHVPDVASMWENIAYTLAPGGVAFSFFPTLYAPPYVLNRLIPEKISRWMLETVFPDRKDDGDNPKFPAYYDHCFSDESKILPILKRAGFSEVVVLPFWGYSYFWKFPGIKQLDAAFTNIARKRQWRAFSSFAYVIATK
ncbi:bifunctional 2-polyprenyl-6-hydroxyphenol methylase/3-demethylubiquinol 3-O-methyltransferase UbiG [Methylocystis sp. Sn-Cys]|uniref:class I SAM-dependent methyltransferase n=1 Tax=Methylocystis sp. Sn-Cys TaxID=1701263 RepID=UPI001920B8A7|nr:methyltransferase domain-containing protein [Methylocystis sp. Sn-Cys]MBL1258597.1 methyltransferase domain-containing protein [Methylocystis sp. Sn-Cys]